MTKTTSTILGLAAAFSLFAATGAFAQASNSQPASGSTMMMKQTPKSDATKMKSDATKMKSDAAGMSAKDDAAKSDQSADASADASMTKPKAHHRMAKNEAQMNEQEAETTKQLNEQQAQYAQNAK